MKNWKKEIARKIIILVIQFEIIEQILRFKGIFFNEIRAFILLKRNFMESEKKLLFTKMNFILPLK